MAQDTFSRTTTYGLGADGTFTYIWTPRDTGYDAAADSLFYVDGSQVVIPATDGDDWDSYAITNPTPPKQGSASFDIYLPTLPGSGDWFAPAFLHLSWTDVTAFGDYRELLLGIEQWERYDSTHAQVAFGPYNGQFDVDWLGAQTQRLFDIELGHWYTLKITYDVGQQLMAYKLFKTADGEPSDYLFGHETSDDWTRFLENWGDGYDGRPWLEMYYSGTVETYLDNLTFDATAPTGLFHERAIDAVIRGRQELEACDPLAITSTYGMGPEYPFIPGSDDDAFPTLSTFFTKSTTNDPTAAMVSGDGSKINTSVVASTTLNAYRLLGRRAIAGYLQFDFFVPTPNPGADAIQSGVHVLLDGPERTYSQGFGVEAISFPGGGSLFQIRALHEYANTAFSVDSFVATNNTWYTAKVMYDGTGRQSVLVKPQGAADSAAIVESELDFQSPVKGSGDRIAFRRVANGHNFATQNLCWLGLRLTLDAVLVVPAGQFSFTANAVLGATQSGSFTINAQFIQLNHTITMDALVAATITRSFSVDALLAPLGFAINAFITDNGIVRHFRDRDHDGTLLDTAVVLDQDFGPWKKGMTLHDLLRELWEWVEKLE